MPVLGEYGPSTEQILELTDDKTNPQVVRDRIKDYWAAKPYWSDEYASDVLEIFDDHLYTMRTSALSDILWRAYSSYHLMDADSENGQVPVTSIQLAGDQGEILTIEMPHYRQLILHKKNLVAGDRLNFSPQAATNDGKALEQVSTARHLLDYVVDQLNLGKGLRDSEEMALVGAVSYVHLGWDPYAGDPTGTRNPVTGHPTYTGDLRWDVLAPWEVRHEPVRQYKDANWHIIRVFRNRYDIAVEALDRGDTNTAEKVLEQHFGANDFQYSDPYQNLGNDQVPVYIAYHNKTPAIPQGRMSVITGDSLVLSDGPLPYPKAPVYRNCPNEFLGTSIAFANSWGWLAMEEMLNSIMSPIISRIDALGHPMISVPEGADWGAFGPYQVHERREGEEPVVPVDLAQIQPALPETYGMMLGELERLSGINSVVQGAPQKNVSSGTMAALIHAQAITFANDDVGAFVRLAEEVALGAIQIYQSRASEDMLLTVVGEEGEPSIQTFKADAIRSIKRVTIRRDSPLMKTTAAKQEAAMALLTQGLFKNPQEFTAYMETGNYHSLFTDAVSQMSTVRSENAMILRGEVPKVGAFEPFHLHVQEHAALEDGFVKSNPEAEQALQKHMADTFLAWQKASMTNPGRLQAMGIPVLPPPMQVQMAMQQQGVAPPAGEEDKDPEKPGPKSAPQMPGVDNKSKMAKGPKMPEPAEPPKEQ